MALRPLVVREGMLEIADMFILGSAGIETITAAKRTYSDLRILTISGGGDALTGDYGLRLATTFGADASLSKQLNWLQFIATFTICGNNVRQPPMQQMRSCKLKNYRKSGSRFACRGPETEETVVD